MEKYRKLGQDIAHTILSNGTKIDDELAGLFKQHNFLVGLSVDGPKTVHDIYRVNKGGSGSLDQVMEGWKKLAENQADFQTNKFFSCFKS